MPRLCDAIDENFKAILSDGDNVLAIEIFEDDVFYDVFYLDDIEKLQDYFINRFKRLNKDKFYNKGFYSKGTKK